MIILVILLSHRPPYIGMLMYWTANKYHRGIYIHVYSLFSSSTHHSLAPDDIISFFFSLSLILCMAVSSVRPSVMIYKKTRPHIYLFQLFVHSDLVRVRGKLFRTQSPVIRNALILDSACLVTSENCLKIVCHDSFLFCAFSLFDVPPLGKQKG